MNVENIEVIEVPSEEDIIRNMNNSQRGEDILVRRFQFASLAVIILGLTAITWINVNDIMRYILFAIILLLLTSIIVIVLYDYIKRLLNTRFILQQDE